MTSEQLEILATAFGLLQGILVMLNKRSNWIIYVIQLGFLIAFSYVNGLYGDMVQSGIMVGICAYAFMQWGKPESAISYLKPSHAITVSALVIVGTLVGYAILAQTDDPLPHLDSFTTVTTFVALALMALRKIEAWIVWFINDIAYIAEYYMLPDQAVYLLALYIIWTAMAVFSFINWTREYNTRGGNI